MTTEDGFRRRAARAADLARDPGAAADLLGFAAALLSAQGRAASAFSALHALEPLSGDLRTDVDRLVPRLSPFLELVAENAPPELAEEALRRSAEATVAAETARGRLLGFLLCADCGGEWPFGRIRCPSCFEENPGKLPAFQTDRHPGVRVEACEVCHRYLKSIDLTIDARPVPEVDDLLSIAVDLWAQEEGFTRIAPGVAGL